MALSDIFQVKCFQTLFGEPILNVFFYQQSTTGSPGSAPDLANVFATDFWVAAWKPLVTTRLTLDQIQVVNGMDNADQYVEDISATGDLDQAAMPTNIAVEFRRRTIGVGSRYSYKRFAGCQSNAIGDGTLSYSVTDSRVYALSQALGGVLVGDEASYTPVQITGGFTLSVSPTFAQFLTGQWQINRRPSHQDTRQQFVWALPLTA